MRGVLLLLPLTLWAADRPVPPVAQKFLNLFQELRQAEAQPQTGRRHVSFSLSEQEINAYLRYMLRATPRPGLDSVTVRIFPYNYVSSLTVIDYDEIERWRPGTIPGLFELLLHGKQSILLDGRFAVADSMITFSVEKAYYGRLWLPAFLVEKVIRMVAARQPEHYDTSRPLPLPFGLRRVWTGDGMIRGNN